MAPGTAGKPQLRSNAPGVDGRYFSWPLPGAGFDHRHGAPLHHVISARLAARRRVLVQANVEIDLVPAEAHCIGVGIA